MTTENTKPRYVSKGGNSRPAHFDRNKERPRGKRPAQSNGGNDREPALPYIDMDAPIEASGFDVFNLPHNLMRSLNHMKYATPTPIQMDAIPAVMKNKDIMGSAQTGTGKTGAFCIPIIAKLMVDPHASALIMAPTRELAAQILTVARSMIHTNTTIRTALLIGGESIGKQYAQLNGKPRLIVGTPGRINDHLRSNSKLFSAIGTVVLDEADRMLDMGFAPQIDEVLKTVPAKHQTLMFSATFAPVIVRFAQKYLNDPIRISIAPEQTSAANIEHMKIECKDTDRYGYLVEELNKREGSIILFIKTKHGADRMAKRLTEANHNADAIHGGLNQRQRDRAIASFRAKKTRIMVATDVAARGLDVPHVEHVINYDLPQVAEDYVHRIGRTARAGAKGNALSLVMPADKGKWAAIQRIMNPRAAGDRPDRDNDRRPGRANPEYNRPNANRSFKREEGADRTESRYERKPFGDKFAGERNYAEKRPFGDRKPFGDKKPFGEKSFGDKPAFGERKSFGEKKPFGDRKPFGDKKPFGDNKSFGDKKPFVKKEWKKPEGNADGAPAKTGFKKPFSKPFNKDGQKPFKKRPFTKAS